MTQVLKIEVPWPAVGGAVLLTVAGAAGVELLPLGALPLRRGLFRESFWKKLGGRITPLYLRQEFRRGPTWAAILLTAFAAAMLPPAWAPLWIIICQWPVQRALHSGRRWQRFVRLHARDGGISAYLGSLWTAQVIQYLLLFVALGILPGSPLSSTPAVAALGCGGLGAVLGGVSVAVEGDSGRPGLVNLVSLTAGTICGVACFASPWFLLAVIYFCTRTADTGRYRLRSVEWFDEDTFVS
ncbi:MAG: hypothetical protein IT285_14775 [Bdellovibrionales bacterium]|nr:hypothetical protein [Bdellovibrionales bacterium]